MTSLWLCLGSGTVEGTCFRKLFRIFFESIPEQIQALNIVQPAFKIAIYSRVDSIYIFLCHWPSHNWLLTWTLPSPFHNFFEFLQMFPGNWRKLLKYACIGDIISHTELWLSWKKQSRFLWKIATSKREGVLCGQFQHWSRLQEECSLCCIFHVLTWHSRLDKYLFQYNQKAEKSENEHNGLSNLWLQ